MTAELRHSGCELRAEGRTLHGTALRFGDVSIVHRERFEAGAFDLSDGRTRWLNLRHDPSRMLAWEGAGLQLRMTDYALEVEARMARTPLHDMALGAVREGRLTGFSVEFHPQAERREGGLRVIERALLDGIGLVGDPSYGDSTVEVRARGDRGGRLGTLRGRVPVGRKLDCRCSPGTCNEAIFEAGSFDNVTKAQAQSARDILAVAGDYSRALASRKRGGVRFWTGPNGDLEFAVDIPNNEAGKQILDAMDNVPVRARPYLDVDASDVEIEGATATYRMADVRALTIGATDADGGWPELVRGKDGEGPPDDMPARRSALWL